MTTSDDEKRRPVKIGNPPRSPMPWLKLWGNFLDCAKFEDVTARYQVLPTARETLRSRYIDLLTVVLRKDGDGKLPSVNEMAFLLRLSVEEMQTTIDAFVDAKLIDRRAKSYYIHDWDYWQYGQTRSAAKQARYRKNRRGNGNALRNDPGNALPERYVTPESRVGNTRAHAGRGEGEGESNPLGGGCSIPPKSPPGGRGGGRAGSALGADPPGTGGGPPGGGKNGKAPNWRDQVSPEEQAAIARAAEPIPSPPPPRPAGMTPEERAKIHQWRIEQGFEKPDKLPGVKS